MRKREDPPAVTAGPTDRAPRRRDDWSALERGDDRRELPLDIAIDRLFSREPRRR